jgi:hypothetical protein
MTGWRGIYGPYSSLAPGEGERGGGFEPSQLDPQGAVAVIGPGRAGGGGRVPSTAALLQGYGGCGGPGPGALIGI